MSVCRRGGVIDTGRCPLLPKPPAAALQHLSPAPADSIINPEAPLALRLSGQLLLGLVRLYLRKLQFLEEDAGLTLRGLVRVSVQAQLACTSAGLPPQRQP